MSMPTEWCVTIFLGLLLASMIMQWVRAKMRKTLVHAVNPGLLSPKDREKWIKVDNSFDVLFKDFRKLQIIKKNLPLLTDENTSKLISYRRFSCAEILVTVSMVVFAATAHWICD